MTSSSRPRSPAVAGSFYPAGVGELAAVVDRLLGEVVVPESEPLAEAYVVPHAGYRYSGQTAARVYARLRQHAGNIRRVVLIGPAHRVPVAGCAAPSDLAWLTPLGAVRVDDPVVRELAARGHASIDDGPHEPEHSLEVQLPFLQRVLPARVPVVPLLVGWSQPDEVAATLAAAAVEPGTVVLCSTDLSHYQELTVARRQDARTAQAVLDLADDRVGARDACGNFALRGLLVWARHRQLLPRVLHLATSADASGDPSRVVGYGAFAFHPHQ